MEYKKLVGILVLILFTTAFSLPLLHPQDQNENYKNTPKEPKTSILLITIDSLRPDHMGIYGYTRNTTPNLDKLGEESAVFLNAYSNAPITPTSLTSLLTSIHPHDHQVNWNGKLSSNYTTLAEILRLHGYHTEAYVSHYILTPEYGLNQGFDYYDYSVLNKGDPHNITSSKELTDKAIGRLDNTTEPFFIWIHYFDTHYDYLNHTGFEYGNNSDIDLYDSEIAYTDYHINRLLDKLKQKELFNKTIIVILADHGEEFREHGNILHNNAPYQELIHIPLIIKTPTTKKQRIQETIDETDIMPTLLKLLETPIPEGLYGTAIPMQKNEFKTKNKTIYAERLKDSKCIIEDKNKLIIKTSEGNINSIELYNLQEDPKEKNNITETEKQKTTELQNKLLNFHQNTTTKKETINLTQDTKQKLRELGYTY